jgi:hypothetical protein
MRREVLEVRRRRVAELAAANEEGTAIDPELGRTALPAQMRQGRGLSLRGCGGQRDGDPEENPATGYGGLAPFRIRTPVPVPFGTIGTISGLRLTESPSSDPVGQAGGWPPWAARPRRTGCRRRARRTRHGCSGCEPMIAPFCPGARTLEASGAHSVQRAQRPAGTGPTSRASARRARPSPGTRGTRSERLTCRHRRAAARAPHSARAAQRGDPGVEGCAR